LVIDGVRADDRVEPGGFERKVAHVAGLDYCPTFLACGFLQVREQPFLRASARSEFQNHD
jgi:hypothetical protein